MCDLDTLVKVLTHKRQEGESLMFKKLVFISLISVFSFSSFAQDDVSGACEAKAEEIAKTLLSVESLGADYELESTFLDRRNGATMETVKLQKDKTFFFIMDFFIEEGTCSLDLETFKVSVINK